MNKFNNIIVNKPWGYEYLVYENENVGIWYLNIDYGKRTSLHSHPNKKTGLIILSGVAKVSFLNHSFKLTPPDKTMIRHGVFHSTEAISKSGLEVLEIETPKDKTDLVRLEDYYGRAGTPYENASHYISDQTVSIPKVKRLTKQTDDITLGDCKLTLDSGKLSRIELDVSTTEYNYLLNQYHSYIILKGGVKYKNHPVLSYGDIVDNTTLIRLSHKFDIYPSEIIGLNY